VQAQAAPEQRILSVTYSRADRVFRGIVTAGALTSLVVLGLIALFLFVRGLPVFREFGLRFLTGSEWMAMGEESFTDEARALVGGASTFSIGPMIVGSVVVSIIALLFAVPLAVGGALYIEFYAPRALYQADDRPRQIVIDDHRAILQVLSLRYAISCNQDIDLR
jgi:phosphate transport system permease protein